MRSVLRTQRPRGSLAHVSPRFRILCQPPCSLDSAYRSVSRPGLITADGLHTGACGMLFPVRAGYNIKQRTSVCVLGRTLNCHGLCPRPKHDVKLHSWCSVTPPRGSLSHQFPVAGVGHGVPWTLPSPGSTHQYLDCCRSPYSGVVLAVALSGVESRSRSGSTHPCRFAVFTAEL